MSGVYGLLDNNVVTTTTMASADFIAALPDAADWVLLPVNTNVGVGWTWADPDWVGPQGQAPQTLTPRPVTGNYLLTRAEWVLRFTDDEVDWLQTQRNVSPSTTASKKLNRLWQAISWTDSVNVIAGGPLDPFYQWLLDNNIPGGQSRIDVLRAAK